MRFRCYLATTALPCTALHFVRLVTKQSHVASKLEKLNSCSLSSLRKAMRKQEKEKHHLKPADEVTHHQFTHPLPSYSPFSPQPPSLTPSLLILNQPFFSSQTTLPSPSAPTSTYPFPSTFPVPSSTISPTTSFLPQTERNLSTTHVIVPNL